MKSRLKSYQGQRLKKRIKYTIMGCSVIFSLIFCMVGTLSSNPGTFAWFTSQTDASGQIQNATTSDLLTISADPVEYETNCNLKNSLTITNISKIETTINVEFEGVILTSMPIGPGETITTNPNIDEVLPNNCSVNNIQYNIRAFNKFVDETYSVSVDQEKLLSTIEVKKDDDKKEVENCNKDNKDNKGVIESKDDKGNPICKDDKQDEKDKEKVKDDKQDEKDKEKVKEDKQDEKDKEKGKDDKQDVNDKEKGKEDKQDEKDKEKGKENKQDEKDKEKGKDDKQDVNDKEKGKEDPKQGTNNDTKEPNKDKDKDKQNKNDANSEKNGQQSNEKIDNSKDNNKESQNNK